MVTTIRDPEFETIGLEPGLEDTLISARTISRFLADLVTGLAAPELSTVLNAEGRFFPFLAGGEEQTLVSDLDLPAPARVICFYRDGELRISKEDAKLRSGGEVVVITRRENLPKLRERFPAQEDS